MEIALIEKDKDSIKIMIKDADMTLISPLVKELVADKEVDEVKFTAGSQNLTHPTLYVKVRSGKPQTALKRASKALANEVKTAKDIVDKELK